MEGDDETDDEVIVCIHTTQVVVLKEWVRR